MAWPASVITRQISFGAATVLETGSDLSIRAVTTATRSLVSMSSGYRLESLQASNETAEAGDQIVFALPVTNQPGWADAQTRMALEVGPNQHSHLYTTKLTVYSGSTALRTYTIGPYPLPQGEGILDGDTMLVPSGTESGVLVPLPDVWVQIANDAAAIVGLRGQPDGVAELDGFGVVPVEQLPVTQIARTPEMIASIGDAIAQSAAVGAILTFPSGSDTSSVPEGGVFGIYTPVTPDPGPGGTVPTRRGAQIVTSGGSTTAFSLEFNPSTPTSGSAVANDDWMVAILGANAPGPGEDFTAPEGWVAVRNDFLRIGTMHSRVFAKKRVAGDSTFEFTYGPQPRHLNGLMLWVRGAADFGSWIVGPGKDRTAEPAEVDTTTALSIPVTRATLVLTISLERTTADEADVTYTGASPWVFAPQEGGSVITIAAGFIERAIPGTTGNATITYPNPQALNAYAFQLGVVSA